MWKPPESAVVRATLGNVRFYYDPDEQVVGIEHICRLCARWRDECQCDPQARMEATLAHIKQNLDSIYRGG